MISAAYKAQVDLLLQMLPYVAKEKSFALKGGTAINLFIRDMPRLSVDIDLTYLPVDSRIEALKNIQVGLAGIKDDIERHERNVKVSMATLREGMEAKLNCQGRGAQIKIEVNTITRGNIFKPQLMQITDSVQEEFGKFAAINVISFAEIYGGKMCAALDRQHPRDLFDMMVLSRNEGITPEVFEAFKVGLISHYKPVGELLSPIIKNQKLAFNNQFAGMTNILFSYEDYELTRGLLIKHINEALSEQDRQFLISFEAGEPRWELFPLDIIQELPAVKWKLLNIRKLKKENPKKHRNLLELLTKILEY